MAHRRKPGDGRHRKGRTPKGTKPKAKAWSLKGLDARRPKTAREAKRAKKAGLKHHAFGPLTIIERQDAEED